MPRYLLDTQLTATGDPGGSALITRRFPEIAVEHRYTAHDQIGRDLWVCRAPSVAHIERWVEASALALRSLQQIEETHCPGTPCAGGPQRRRTPPGGNMTMSTLSAIRIPRPSLASAIAALVVATMAAIALFAVLEDDSGPARAGASVSKEQSGDLGTRTGSADALERQAELDRPSGHASPDAIDRPVAGNGSAGTAGSPDAIDRAEPSSNRHGSADAAEQWLDQ